jgi:hypothetical protein
VGFPLSAPTSCMTSRQSIASSSNRISTKNLNRLIKRNVGQAL